MTRIVLPLTAIAAAIATATVPVQAAEIQIMASGPVIELTVTENVAAEPDIATVSAGVTTLAPTAAQAMQDNARAMTSVIARIEALGIARQDIQTSGITLNPEYDWDQATGQQRFRGYRVANRVQVKLRQIARTGEVLDALVAAGATDIGGVGWEIDDPAPATDRARTAAFATARARALAYARLAGYADVRLLEVSETVMPGRPMMMEVQASAARDVSTPVRPGMVEAGVTITVKFEMLSS